MGIDSCFETCRQFSMPEVSSSATAVLMARESKATSGVIGVEGSSSSDHCLMNWANSSTVMRIGGMWFLLWLRVGSTPYYGTVYVVAGADCPELPESSRRN